MRCFYHIDMDGKCAAAIVRLANPEKKIFFSEINYNHKFPFEEIRRGEEVVMVDFSLLKGEFEKLLGITEDFVWIDHHKTAIEYHEHLKDKIAGARSEDIPSAAALAWDFYFQGKPMPRVVELIDDYDTWQFKLGEDTRLFQIGCRTENVTPWAAVWKDWLKEEFNPAEIIDRGRMIKRYIEKDDYARVMSWAFYTEWDGMRVISCNGKLGSQVFESVDEGTYDIMMPFFFDGEKYAFSMYSKKNGVDVGSIAKRMGGGGHTNSAGFVTDKWPFKKITRLREVKKNAKKTT